MNINSLLQNTGMWRASSIDCGSRRGIPTGFDELDSLLPGNGLPTDGITEVLHDYPGIGEMRLLAKSLARLSHTDSRWILWVSPPFMPYAPALADAGIELSRILLVKPANRSEMLWVLEKSLASKSCSAVLGWPYAGNASGKGFSIREKDIRRLQVASRDGNCLGVLFRPTKAARLSSPAELRLEICPFFPSPLEVSSGLKVRILKRRGGWATEPMSIRLGDTLNQVTPDFSEMKIARRRPVDDRIDYSPLPGAWSTGDHLS